MTPEETAAALALAYSQSDSKATEDEAARELTLWQFAFAGDPYATVEYGIKLWFKGGKPFVPKPSEIRQMIADRILALDVDHEWGQVRRALRTYGQTGTTFANPDGLGYRDVPRPPFHPLVEAVIASMGWQEMCLSEKPDVVRGSFIKALERRIQLAKDDIIYGDQPLPLPHPREAEALPEGEDDPAAIWAVA